jgi:N-acetyl-gamma-glutamylphosphate reductase
MNAPVTGPPRLVIVGATGMAGGYALRYALNHPAVGCMTAIGRGKLGISHPKLAEVCIETLRTAPLSREHFRVRTQRSSAWARIRGRRRTPSSAR